MRAHVRQHVRRPEDIFRGGFLLPPPVPGPNVTLLPLSYLTVYKLRFSSGPDSPQETCGNVHSHGTAGSEVLQGTGQPTE